MSNEDNRFKHFEKSSGEVAGWTEAWRTVYKEAGIPVPKGFLIPVQDLMGVLTEMNVLTDNGNNNYTYNKSLGRDVRAYMGFDGSVPHLVMLGTKVVNGVYRDLYDGGVDGQKGTLTGEEGFEGSGIYDFSRPCPNACDDDSKLNSGG